MLKITFRGKGVKLGNLINDELRKLGEQDLNVIDCGGLEP